ncbi:hypothetical protein DE146DRAFT_451064 [Phaeosphaeria sp. MPI-PUGE-AT-0046c]|nr:hypothetical protein DE146DRAFT_451064 [Phaeosphaeria sp. MPI-PUGE-AT-0046c]
MYRPSWTTWTIATCLSTLTTAARNDTFGLLEVDLVFPRNEATYLPFSESHVPVIFAFQNPNDTISLANAFRPRITYSIWDQNNKSNIVEKRDFDLFAFAVTTGYPNKLWHDYHDIASVEGTWQMDWTMRWQTCDGGDKNFTSTQSIKFSTKASADKLDLVAATNNETACPNVEGMGVAWNITSMSGEPGEMCAEMTSPLPTPTPCKIHIDSAEASRISASAPAHTHTSTPPPDEKSGAQELFVGRAVCLLAVAGSLLQVFL